MVACLLEEAMCKRQRLIGCADAPLGLRFFYRAKQFTYERAGRYLKLAHQPSSVD